MYKHVCVNLCWNVNSLCICMYASLAYLNLYIFVLYNKGSSMHIKFYEWPPQYKDFFIQLLLTADQMSSK